MSRGSRRVATSRPAFQVHAQRTKGRTTLRLACPPIHALRPQPGLEVRTKLVRLIGAQTRVASPSVLAPCGIKRRSEDLSAGSLGQVAARRRDSLHVTTSAAASVFLPLEIPTGLSKRNKFRAPSVCRDAQRRADKLGRHARCSSSRPSSPVCQGKSKRNLRRFTQNGQQHP